MSKIKKVKMFGQEDTVSVEFWDKTDKTLVENIIKENILYSVKAKKYSPISEPVISIYEYLKRIGDDFMRVSDKDEADLIVFHTRVKVVKL